MGNSIIYLKCNYGGNMNLTETPLTDINASKVQGNNGIILLRRPSIKFGGHVSAPWSLLSNVPRKSLWSF
jgi:hypothetical protein